MTFAYNVTTEGMVHQITEAYRDLFEGLEPKAAAARYLAEKIEAASWELFPGPTKVMHHIRDIAEHCANRDSLTNRSRFLEWVSPSGMPVCNKYQKSKVNKIYLSWSGSVKFKIADGCYPKPKKTKCLNSAAPNFIHSQDAAHLIRVKLHGRGHKRHRNSSRPVWMSGTTGATLPYSHWDATPPAVR
jgi:DNA-directed RNA polymerase